MYVFWRMSRIVSEKEQNMEEIRNRRRKYKELVMEGEHRKVNYILWVWIPHRSRVQY